MNAATWWECQRLVHQALTMATPHRAVGGTTAALASLERCGKCFAAPETHQHSESLRPALLRVELSSIHRAVLHGSHKGWAVGCGGQDPVLVLFRGDGAVAVHEVDSGAVHALKERGVLVEVEP